MQYCKTRKCHLQLIFTISADEANPYKKALMLNCFISKMGCHPPNAMTLLSTCHRDWAG